MKDKNLFEFCLKEWKNLPRGGGLLAIWGIGGIGRKIGIYLIEHNIEWAFYVVNRKYYDEEKTELLGHRIVILEDYLEKNKLRLIVGFQGYKESILDNLNRKNIEKVYALDFIGKLAIGEDSTINDEFLRVNKDKLSELREAFFDEKSREALDIFLNQKITGIYEKKYDTNTQYFDADIVKLKENEVLIDCGAYHGETILDFMYSLKEQGISGFAKAIAVEADKQNAEITRQCLNEYLNVEVIEKGIWDESGTICFSDSQETSSRISEEGNISIPVITIDDLAEGEIVTIIKMDIEGAELKGLKGAENTIRKYKPKLAVCVYHRPEDLVTIPQWIRTVNPEYKLYLRNYHHSGIETVLYAI